MLQVGEGRHAGTEVVQREAVAQAFQLLDELHGILQVGDCAGFGDLETDVLRRDAIQRLQVAQEVDERRIADGRAGEVDGAYLDRFQAVIRPPRSQPLEGLAHHPAVDLRHQPETLGSRHELPRRHQLVVLVMQAQQQLDMHALPTRRLKRIDALGEQAETILFHGQADALHPVHLAEPQVQLHVVGTEHLGPVAPLLLGHVAGHVGTAQRFLDRAQRRRNVYHADAGTDLEGPSGPGEMHPPHRLPQMLGDLPGQLRRAVLQQDAELVAAQPRQGVVVA
ncbi:hypothetical protein D3C78_652490 [compost metagenome]